jgi:hypothetical protein
LKRTGFERSFQGLTGCYPLGTPALYFFIWIPLLVFETILCTLMLYKAWRTYKGEYGPNLLNLLIRDRCVSWCLSEHHKVDSAV